MSLHSILFKGTEWRKANSTYPPNIAPYSTCVQIPSPRGAGSMANRIATFACRFVNCNYVAKVS